MFDVVGTDQKLMMREGCLWEVLIQLVHQVRASLGKRLGNLNRLQTHSKCVSDTNTIAALFTTTDQQVTSQVWLVSGLLQTCWAKGWQPPVCCQG